jgi:hypothetical protein
LKIFFLLKVFVDLLSSFFRCFKAVILNFAIFLIKKELGSDPQIRSTRRCQKRLQSLEKGYEQYFWCQKLGFFSQKIAGDVVGSTAQLRLSALKFVGNV